VEDFFNHNIGIDEYITGNRFIDICNEVGAFFCKTDFLNHFKQESCKVLVTHNSDYHIDKSRHSLAPSFASWFAQNKDIEDPSVTPIPIGLENMNLRTMGHARGGIFSSEVNGALQKASLIDRYSSLNLDKNNLVYLNFNINTNRKERSHVKGLFSDKGWVTSTSNLSMEEYYFDLVQHKYVFSPPGNGADCHRTWEALYLGVVPIVKKSLSMHEFSELPILFVNNWEDIGYTYLEEKYEEMRSKLFDLSKMKISYWKKRINEEVQK
tara:strand:+ start:1176 stop:1976 length:801 start_codon:yes stop_codon:yes gene_type:complete